MLTQQSSINFVNFTAPHLVSVVQDDTGRVIAFRPDCTIPVGAVASFCVVKPSGEIESDTASVAENKVICALTASALSEVGQSCLQVKLEANGEELKSFPVILQVEDAP